MDRALQTELAESFLARHHAPPVLLLPNAWDAMSATALRCCRVRRAGNDEWRGRMGAWVPGRRTCSMDRPGCGDARVVRVAQVPVTADIEAGYGATPAEVGTHVAEIIQTGVVGINLEDGLHGPMRSIEDAARRVTAAREAARRENVPIVLNARCDVFHLQHGEESTRFDATVERCKAYLAAGADCVYPFGLRDPATIAAFVKAIGAPVNITGRAGMPDAKSLECMGVARITIASAPTLVTMSAIARLAAELRASGGFDMLNALLRHSDAQALFQTKGDGHESSTGPAQSRTGSIGGDVGPPLIRAKLRPGL